MPSLVRPPLADGATVAEAAAAVPPPPRKVTVGADVYHVPDEVTRMAVSVPVAVSISAMAVAPEPLPPEKSTAGGAM